MIKWKLLTGNNNPPLIREIKCIGFLHGLKDLFDFNYINFLYFKEDTFIDQELTTTFSEYLKNKFSHDHYFFWNLIDQEKIACKKLITFSNDNSSLDINALNHDQLLIFFKNYLETYKNCTKFLLLNTLMGTIVEKKLEQVLHTKKSLLVNIHKNSTFLFVLSKETETLKFNKEMLKLSMHFNEKKLRQVVEKFAWLNLEDGFGKPFTLEDIKQRILPEKEAKQTLITLEDYSKKVKNEVTKIIKKGDFSKEEQKLYKLMQKLIYYRAKINEDLNKSGFYLLNLFYSFASKFNLTYEELFHLSIEEVKQMIKKNVIPQELIKERVINHAVMMKDQKISILSGNDLNNIQFQSYEKINTDTLIGKCVYPGKLKSSVVIVNSLKDLNKVKDGQVLVTKFTTPYYVPAMQKASAIITDIGGATSHGAILATELGKPCIIGTKIATKILKDGDIVEIDAKNGIIRKLNH
jgi:phosphohistidine swiveling domain-containing protein